jgi:phage antirepressor YoqD-like protein
MRTDPVSFAKHINPLILDELRRLKATQRTETAAKPTADRIDRLVAAVTSATLRQLANMQVQLQA